MIDRLSQRKRFWNNYLVPFWNSFKLKRSNYNLKLFLNDLIVRVLHTDFLVSPNNSRWMVQGLASNLDLGTVNNPSKSWPNSSLREIASGHGLCTACWTSTSIWTLYRIIWLFILFFICNIKNRDLKPVKSGVIKFEPVLGPLIKTKFSWNKSYFSSSYRECSSGMDNSIIDKAIDRPIV